MTHKWNEDETEYFVTVMEELVIEGQRADAGQFKPGSFEKIAKKMNEKYPGASFTAKHCKNKHKRLKEKYQSAADMAACSGFGWSDEKQCVLVDSKEVLEQYIKQHPLRFYSPGKPFPLFLRLEAVFGKDRANGMFSMSGVDAEEHVAQESDICMTVEETEMNNITAEESDCSIPNFSNSILS